MVTVTLTFDRETQNSVRYASSEFGTVYVPKHVLVRMGPDRWPAHLTLTLDLAK